MADNEVLGVLELDENLADAEKPPEIPAGAYLGEIQDVQTPTSGKGNQYYQILFVISPENLPEQVREHYEDGAKLFWNRILVPVKGNRRALYNLRLFVEALGLDSNTNTIDPNEWMGRQAKLRIVMGKYQGEERAEIRAVEAAEAAPRGRTAAPRGRAAPEDDEGNEPVTRTPARGSRQAARPAARGGRR